MRDRTTVAGCVGVLDVGGMGWCKEKRVKKAGKVG